MRGLTPEERFVLEERGESTYDVGIALVSRGLLRIVDVEVPGYEGCNMCLTTEEGKRALRLDWLARLPR